MDALYSFTAPNLIQFNFYSADDMASVFYILLSYQPPLSKKFNEIYLTKNCIKKIMFCQHFIEKFLHPTLYKCLLSFPNKSFASIGFPI